MSSRAATLATAAAHGVLVGVASGIGAWVFRLMVAAVHDLAFLGRLSVDYDANVHTPASPWGPWVVLVPVAGAIVVVFVVRHFAPEVKGHGVPEVMEAIHYRSGRIRPVVAVAKAIASAVSIGTGGSVGREGPIAQIGAAFGATLGRTRTVSADERQVLVAAGAAAGIAATFNAPLGGVLFAIELLLVVVSPRSLLVVGVAVATGVGVARLLLGSDLAFTVLSLESVKPFPLGWGDVAGLVVLGIVTGVASAVTIRGLYRAEDIFDGRFRDPYVAHAVGMGVVGLTMYACFLWLGEYAIEGVGYAIITDVLRGAITDPWVLLVLAGGKWVATTLTLGSGASGGIFSPSLFIGATLGAALGHGLGAAGLAVDPAMFALAGMAATVAGTTGAVLTGIVMVSEMTGDFGVSVPLLLVAVTATIVRWHLSPSTIYTEKLLRRGRWVPAGLEAAGLGTRRAVDLVGRGGDPPTAPRTGPARSVERDASLIEVLDALGAGPAVSVVDGDDAIGVITRDDAAAAVEPMGMGRLRWSRPTADTPDQR